MNPANPKVSVIIPCFNYGQYLAEAISSALAQSHAPHQIIVINDGSTDDTATVAGRFAGRIDYVPILRSGVCQARNVGLKRATGDFVVFLDADDALDPNYIALTVDAWAQAPLPKPAFVYTQRQDFSTGATTSHYPPFDPHLLKFRNYIMVSALLEAGLAREQGFDPEFANGLEDYDFFLGLAAKGHRGLLLDQPLLRVRRHDLSRTIGVEDPPMRWKLTLQLLHKHQALYSPGDRRQFMRKLRRLLANRIEGQRHPAQLTSERLAILGQLIRFRARLPAILSQLAFVFRIPSPPIKELNRA